jgi:hypothetical protein
MAHFWSQRLHATLHGLLQRHKLKPELWFPKMRKKIASKIADRSKDAFIFALELAGPAYEECN